MRHLVILSYGASGTTAVVDQLLNNENVFLHHNKEPLNTKEGSGRNARILHGTHWYDDHIAELISLAESNGQKLLIHIKPMHLSPISVSIPEAVQKLQHQFDFILILRKNYLARKCSSAFKMLRHKNNDPQAKVTLNINLADFAEDDRTHREMLRLTEPYNPFFIDYERDLHRNTRKTIDALCHHFGFYHPYKYRPMKPNYHAKKNQWSAIKLQNKIANFDEIRDKLSGTKYEWMLSE